MKDFEDKIKNRLLEHRSLKDVKPNDLWTSINDELHLEGETKVENDQASRKLFFKRIATILIFTFSFSAAFFIYKNYFTSSSYKNSSDKNSIDNNSYHQNDKTIYPNRQESASIKGTKEKTNMNAAIEKEVVVSKSISSAIPQKDQNVSGFNNRDYAQSNMNNDISEKRSASNFKPNIVASNAKYLNSKILGSTKQSNQSISTNIDQKVNIDTENIVGDINSGSTVKYSKNKSQNANARSEDSILNQTTKTNQSGSDNLIIANPLEIIQPIQSYVESDVESDFSYPPVSHAKIAANKFYVGVFAGRHVVKNLFASNTALNDAFKVQLGSIVSFEIGKKINSTISIASGINYQKSNTQFNHVSQFDTLAIYPDYSTTELIDHLATRTIKHKNTNVSISIPLSLKAQKNKGNWSLGSGFGLAFNLLQSQKGRSLNQFQNVTQFPNSENDSSPIMDTYFSYHLKPFVSYHLSSNLQVQIQGDLQFLDYGESGFYNQKTSALLYGLNAGVVFKL